MTAVATAPTLVPRQPAGAAPADGIWLEGTELSTALRNLRLMRLLQRIARAFDAEKIPLMVLKGAALNLLMYERADERPMDDLDLMIRPEDVDRARLVLERLGGLRGAPQVREDFFPRFHYEAEYRMGSIYPCKIDLHVRPFRPMRYVATIPANAFWQDAQPISFGRATILVPSTEDMLIHLAVHAAVHGRPRAKWLEDIRRWLVLHGADMDWEKVICKVTAWGLVFPFRQALAVPQQFESLVPDKVRSRLCAVQAGICERVALWQAPRDLEHPAAHFAANVLCTPNWRLSLGYLAAVVLPDRTYLADHYDRRHTGWVACAHLLRWLKPLLARLPKRLTWWDKTEVRPSAIHGIGIFATRDIRQGQVIARYHGRSVGRDGMYVIRHRRKSGAFERVELTGRLKFLNHSCKPNGVFDDFSLIALQAIRAGQEITVQYGRGACGCGEREAAVA